MKLKEGDIKIVPKAQKLWIDVKRNAETMLHQAEDSVVIQKAIIKLAEQKIEAEKQ